MEIALGYVLKGLVLPPGLNFLAIAGAVVLLRNRSRWRRATLIAAIVLLWLLSTPVIAGMLLRALEATTPVTVAQARSAGAIVVLGGSRRTDAPEYGYADTVGADTLERLRYGAALARETRLPLAVSGGRVLDPDGEAVATLMARVLTEEFHLSATWVEDTSRNTAQNARHLAAMMPVRHIVLVTHALHMRRAAAEFTKAGFDVVPAPMGFRVGAWGGVTVFDLLPSAAALVSARDALHEWLGRAYYRVRYSASSFESVFATPAAGVTAVTLRSRLPRASVARKRSPGEKPAASRAIVPVGVVTMA